MPAATVLATSNVRGNLKAFVGGLQNAGIIEQFFSYGKKTEVGQKAYLYKVLGPCRPRDGGFGDVSHGYGFPSRLWFR